MARRECPAGIHDALVDGEQRLVGTRRVQPSKRHQQNVAALAARMIRSTHRGCRHLRSRPGDLVHREGAAIPRRLACSSRLAEATSSVTYTIRVSMPSSSNAAGDAEFIGPRIVAEGENHSGTSIRAWRSGTPAPPRARRMSPSTARPRTGSHHTVIGREVAGASTDHEADLASTVHRHGQPEAPRRCTYCGTPRRSHDHVI
jgi:hypothetical protein